VVFHVEVDAQLVRFVFLLRSSFVVAGDAHVVFVSFNALVGHCIGIGLDVDANQTRVTGHNETRAGATLSWRDSLASVGVRLVRMLANSEWQARIYWERWLLGV